MSTDLPAVALSVMQPWAWLIVSDLKDIENRTWRQAAPKRILVHAGLKVDKEAMADLLAGYHPVTGEQLFPEFRAQVAAADFHRGGIVGAVDMGPPVDASLSPWFVGPWGYPLRNPEVLPFMPMKGALGFFKAQYQAPA